MCLARVEFVGEEDRNRDALSEVAQIERTPEGLRITDLFGNSTEVEVEIRSIDFMSSVVRVESLAVQPASQEGLPTESGVQTQDSSGPKGARR